ncbi:hypothetical protein GCM10022271_19320 [Corallibacter vietnamensis]|uniref:Secretion system C-terminal sorting domain-containing protein n=1 Tax=Corallibacter vietnamensis TaxID=904130 RepID=A0ABP7H6Y5_9FLAO
MKKITLLCIAIFCFAFSWQANAQFTESFDTEIPATWTILNEDGGSETWNHQTQYPYAGAGHARVRYESAAHNDFLITPQFTVTANTSDRISFFAGIDGTYFTETFDVRISTTGTAAADFTTIASETATTDADGDYTQYTYDLSAYVGSSVYVAIVATDTNRFYLYVDEFVNDGLPNCTAAVIDSQTIVPDCGNSQYSIDVVVSDAGDAGTVINDGTTDYSVVAGTVTVGPYAVGTSVTLNVVHTDGACDYSLGDFEYTECPTLVNCGTPVNTTYCYTASDNTEFTYQSSDGSSLYVEFNAGEVENSWDELIVLDSDGTTELYNGYGASGDLTGLTFTSSGDTITVKIQADGSGQCDTDGYTSWDFDVTCLNCTSAVASAVAVEDCVNSEFSINVTVSDLGDATTITDGTTPQPVAATMTFGPYAFGTEVTLEVMHSDVVCDFELGTYNIGGCPPVNDTPNGAITLTLDEGTDCGANAITGVSNAFTTDSGEAAPACGSYGTALDRGDLWYAFVAQNATVTLNTDNYSVVTSIAGAYYSGTVGALVEEGCTEFASGWPWELSGLTVGETYYLRVWDYGNDQTGTFDLCGYYLSCTQAEATASVTDDCGAYTFTIDVDVTSAGDIVSVNDGTTSHAVVAGVNTLPVTYNFGDTITLTAEHSDSTCDFEIGSYSSSCPPPPPACGGNFYDSGAISSDYSSNEDITTTICPDVPGDAVNVTFTFFSTEDNSIGGTCYDGLTIYNGADTSAPTINPTTGTIWCWDRDDTTPSGTGDLQGMTISSTDASGCLTFVFTSDGSSTREGWEATVGCSPLSLEDFGLTGFTYFPNPVNNTLSLRGVKEIQNVAVYNMLGQEVLRTAPNAVDHDLDMSGLQTGAYFVKVSIGNSTKTVRIIKN